MKKILLFILSVLSVSILNAQVTYTVNQGVGDTFNPDQLTVTVGDIIHFNLSAPHNVTQVSQATWNANGTTPLTGGFVFTSGSGNYTTTAPGVIYYVCTVHVAFGMKGTITVNAVTGINDVHYLKGGKVFPDPATDFITYQTKGYANIQEIRIVDITGKAVKILHKPDITDEQIRIDISNLNKGIYFILVRSEDGIESGKFLKS